MKIVDVCPNCGTDRTITIFEKIYVGAKKDLEEVDQEKYPCTLHIERLHVSHECKNNLVEILRFRKYKSFEDLLRSLLEEVVRAKVKAIRDTLPQEDDFDI